MVLDVKSVDRLLVTRVPCLCHQSGLWIFLTGHEAYDWETGTSDEVTGPPGFPLHAATAATVRAISFCGGCVVSWANSAPTCRMPSGSISITRCRERLPPIISPGTPNSATISRRAPRWSWSAASPPTRRYRHR